MLSEDFPWARLRDLYETTPITEVISGGATGADTWGEHFADDMGIHVKYFPADWKTHGRAAGPIRNAEMAKYADAVVLCPGGRGTDSMASEARKAGIKIFDWRCAP